MMSLEEEYYTALSIIGNCQRLEAELFYLYHPNDDIDLSGPFRDELQYDLWQIRRVVTDLNFEMTLRQAKVLKDKLSDEFWQQRKNAAKILDGIIEDLKNAITLTNNEDR